MIFKGLSAAKNCLKLESAPLNEQRPLKKIRCLYLSLNFFKQDLICTSNVSAWLLCYTLLIVMNFTVPRAKSELVPNIF